MVNCDKAAKMETTQSAESLAAIDAVMSARKSCTRFIAQQLVKVRLKHPLCMHGR